MNSISDDKKLVIKAIKLVFSAWGYNNLNALMHRDYETVSEAIQIKTGILISVSTLKRLEKGSFSKIPQPGTLNALAVFLEYKNWQEYRMEHMEDKPEIIVPKNHLKTSVFPKKLAKILRTVSRPTYLISISILIVLFFWYDYTKPPTIPAFDFRRTTSHHLPNSVVFSYDVSGIDADSFFIQQSWDRNRRVAIDPAKNTLTDIYYEPGHHVAKLIANDQIIKTKVVIIPTDGWFYYAKEADYSALPVYLEKPQSEKISNITRSDLEKAAINLATEKYLFSTNFPQKPLAGSDNFKFRIKFKVTTLRADYCPFLVVELHTQKDPIMIKAITKGCESESFANFGNQFLSGKNNDLSALALNVLNANEIEFLVKNRKLSIFYNDKLVHAGTIKENNGNLTGISFISNGMLEVSDYELADPEGRVFMQYN